MMRGKVRIELTDVRTGAKKEISKSNFISKGARQMMENRARELFTGHIKGNGLSLAGAINPFELLYLSNAAHAEDPENEWLAVGDAVGQAYSTSASAPIGNDTFGQLNEAETVVTPEKVRLVFDFPTNKANGTFQSIFFRSFGEGNTNPPPGLSISKLSGATKIEEHAEFFYVSFANKLQKMDKDYNQVEQITVSNIVDFTILDGYIYVTKGTSSIFKYSCTDLQSPPITIPTSVSNIGGITVDAAGRVMCIANVGGGNYSLIAYASDFQDYERVQQNIGMVERLNPLNYHKGVLISRFINLSDMLMVYGSRSGFSNYQILGFGKSGVYIQSGAFVFFSPIPFLGSRVRLDAPVTKNSNQAMKITYEFILPPYLS